MHDPADSVFIITLKRTIQKLAASSDLGLHSTKGF